MENEAEVLYYESFLLLNLCEEYHAAELPVGDWGSRYLGIEDCLSALDVFASHNLVTQKVQSLWCYHIVDAAAAPMVAILPAKLLYHHLGSLAHKEFRSVPEMMGDYFALRKPHHGQIVEPKAYISDFHFRNPVPMGFHLHQGIEVE
jgi:hypothetical protein